MRMRSSIASVQEEHTRSVLQEGDIVQRHVAVDELEDHHLGLFQISVKRCEEIVLTGPTCAESCRVRTFFGEGTNAAASLGARLTNDLHALSRSDGSLCPGVSDMWPDLPSIQLQTLTAKVRRHGSVSQFARLVKRVFSNSTISALMTSTEPDISLHTTR